MKERAKCPNNSIEKVHTLEQNLDVKEFYKKACCYSLIEKNTWRVAGRIFVNEGGNSCMHDMFLCNTLINLLTCINYKNQRMCVKIDIKSGINSLISQKNSNSLHFIHDMETAHRQSLTMPPLATSSSSGLRCGSPRLIWSTRSPKS